MPKIQEGWRLKKGHTCPKCLSDIRYRTYCVAIREELTPTTESQNILEIASAEGSPLLFSHLPNKLFVSADINNRTAHVSMDVRNLPFQDSSIDFVLCSHVLEHVKEDVVAMKEFFRVLRRGKKSLIQVPIDATLAQTIEYEKPNPKESGHVRMYGMDYEHRLREAGFTVYPKRVWKDAREMEYFGGRDEVLYFAHKD